jgi:hypothetical protein
MSNRLHSFFMWRFIEVCVFKYLRIMLYLAVLCRMIFELFHLPLFTLSFLKLMKISDVPEEGPSIFNCQFRKTPRRNQDNSNWNLAENSTPDK